MIVRVIIGLILCLLLHSNVMGECVIDTPHYITQKDYRFDINNPLSAYTFSVRCTAGINFFVRHVSPDIAANGYEFRIVWAHNSNKYMYLSFYRDANRTQYITLSTEPVISATASGDVQKFTVYPNLRVENSVSGCIWNVMLQKFICPASVLRATINWKVVF